MGVKVGPNILNKNLNLHMDAGSDRSYPNSGNTWYDLSDKGHVGTLRNSPTYSSNYVGVMTFDGTNDKVEIPNFTQMFYRSLTMECWMYWNDDSRSIIFGNYNAGAKDINFEKNGGRSLRFYWNRGERDVSTAGNVVTTTGEWHHIVIQRCVSDNTFKFWVNGSLIQSTSNIGTNISSTGSTFRIGGDSRDGVTITNGGISVLRLYSEQLSQNEILQNYNSQKGRYGL